MSSLLGGLGARTTNELGGLTFCIGKLIEYLCRPICSGTIACGHTSVTSNYRALAINR